MTTDPQPAIESTVPQPAGQVPEVPARDRFVEGDTLAAVAATVIGVVCVLVSAVGMIGLCVVPLGLPAVVAAAVVTGVIVALLLAGGVWAWVVDRRGRRI